MAGVIDIRDNPAIDMQVAQSIGNILSAVGRAEQNRQKRYQMDKMLLDVSNGTDPMQAAINVKQSGAAPYDPGLAGVGQRVGRLLGGTPRDYGDDIAEAMLNGKMTLSLMKANPMWQAQLEAARTGVAGEKQQQEITGKIAPSKVKAAELGVQGQEQAIQQNKAMNPLEVDAAQKRNTLTGQQIEQNQVMMPAEQQSAALNLNKQQRNYQWEGEDRDLAIKRDMAADMLTSLKLEGAIDDQTYSKKLRDLEVQSKEADIRYRDAMAQKAGSPNYSSVNRLQQRINEDDRITDNKLKNYQAEAAGLGGTVQKTMDTPPPGVQKDADGSMYFLEKNGKKRPFTPTYSYEVVVQEQGSQGGGAAVSFAGHKKGETFPYKGVNVRVVGFDPEDGMPLLEEVK